MCSDFQEVFCRSSLTNPPQHVAIIMDGNRRWGTQHGKPLSGHLEGVGSVQRCVEGSVRLGIPYLTLYAFSTENWKRPVHEIALLHQLICETLVSYGAKMKQMGICLHVIGDMKSFPQRVRDCLESVCQDTAEGSKLHLTLALNYGGRDELVRAMKKIVAAVQRGDLCIDDVGVSSMSQYLDTFFLPDPNLMIRTADETRLSNFLLWQSAYAEFYTVPVLWPDFTEHHLFEACLYYQSRLRKEGA